MNKELSVRVEAIMVYNKVFTHRIPVKHISKTEYDRAIQLIQDLHSEFIMEEQGNKEVWEAMKRYSKERDELAAALQEAEKGRTKLFEEVYTAKLEASDGGLVSGDDNQATEDTLP